MTAQSTVKSRSLLPHRRQGEQSGEGRGPGNKRRSKEEDGSDYSTPDNLSTWVTLLRIHSYAGPEMTSTLSQRSSTCRPVQLTFYYVREICTRSARERNERGSPDEPEGERTLSVMSDPGTPVTFLPYQPICLGHKIPSCSSLSCSRLAQHKVWAASSAPL